MKKLLKTFCLLLVTLPLLAGGGWTNKQGEGYFKLNQSIIIAKNIYDKSGVINGIPTFGFYTTALYCEYGLFDNLTTVLHFPMFVRSTLNEQRLANDTIVSEGDALSALGDIDLSFKYGIIQGKPTVLSASVLFGIPTGVTAGGETQILQSGDGEFNQLLRFDVSHSFHPLPLYVSAYMGVNNRTKGFSEELHLGGEVGYSPLKSFYVIAKLLSVNSFQNGESTLANANGVFSNNIEYFSYGPEFVYSIKENFGATFTYLTASGGKNILASPAYSLGVFLKVK